MKDKILKILQKNAKVSYQTIADRLGVKLEVIVASIKELEKSGVILGYRTVLDQSKINDDKVRALIEVKTKPQREGGYDKMALRISRFENVTDVYLISGQYDLNVQVSGDSLQEVASFVATKLSPLNGVVSCSTHFILKKYKEAGFCQEKEKSHERLSVTP